MAITLVGTATASATTVTIPTTQAGDFVVIYAFRGAATGAPTLPAGWTSILSGNGTTCAARSGYKIATGSSTTSGTWTNAAELICHIYRPSAGNVITLGQAKSAVSTTNTVNYPALSPMGDSTSGNSWVAGFTGVRNLVETINTAPAGMTLQSNVAGASFAAAGFDTNGGVSSWSSTNVVTTGTATGSITHVLELVLAPTTNPLSSYVYQYVAGGGNPFSRGNTGNAYKIPLQTSSGAANTLVLFLTFDGGATVSSVADNINGTWGAATRTALGGAGNLDSYAYVFPNISAGLATITVTFSSSTTVFQPCVIELPNIATSSTDAGSHSVAISTTIGAGSFTPTNNNATGGNLILAYFAKADQVPGQLTTHMLPGGSFTPLSSDIGWANANDSMTKYVEGFVQTTSAAINPTMVSGGETGDHWNSIAVALKIATGTGTAPNTQIRANSIHHFATLHYPTTGNFNLQLPSTGNLRVIMSTDPNLKSSTVTDNEGNTWTIATTPNPGIGVWFFPNANPNPNLMIFITGGGTDITLSWRYLDISNADPSPFDSAIANAQTLNGLSSFTVSPAPSPTSSIGMTVANIELGQGPGLAATAPSGNTWALCTYTGETDLDLIENADIMALYRYTASGSQTQTYSITVQASNSSAGGLISFKEASTTPAVWGWEVQPTQPVHYRQQRAASTFRGHDGTDAGMILFRPSGWEVRPYQPRRREPDQRPAAIFRGDDGTQATLLAWRNDGWEVPPFQPSHPRPERFGALAPVEIGTEAPFAPPPVTLRWAWDIASFQPPHPAPERRGAIMRGDEGTTARLLGWQNDGWEVRALDPSRRDWRGGFLRSWTELLLAPSAPPPVGWTLISHVSATLTTTGSTAGINTTGADLIVVLVTQYANSGAAAILSDVPSNSYTPLTGQVGVVPDGILYYVHNPNVSTNHIFTLTTGNGLPFYGTIFVQAWSGSAASPFDVQNGTVTAGGVASGQPGSITPSLNGELIIFGMGTADQIATPYTMDSGFTQPDPGISWQINVTEGGGLGYLVQNTAAAINPTAGWSGTNSFGVALVIASFKPATQPATTPAWGWDIGLFQPPRREPDQRLGVLARGDDGAEGLLRRWLNDGWEIPPLQPPRREPDLKGAAIMRGDDGAEATFLRFFSYGWPVAPFQPPHPRPERFGAVVPTEPGTEAPFVPPPSTIRWAWDVLPFQPPRPRRIGGLTDGDQGNEATFHRWFVTGWEIAPYQPRRFKPAAVGSFSWSDVFLIPRTVRIAPFLVIWS